MKKFLVSGFNPFYGTFGGIQSGIFYADSEENAKFQAIQKFGEAFGHGAAPHEKGISVEETTLDQVPTL